MTEKQTQKAPFQMPAMLSITYNVLKEHPEDSMREIQLVVDGEPQNSKQLVSYEDGKNKLLVPGLSMSYKVVPFSMCVRSSDEVAEEIGAVPFNEFTGQWFTKVDKHLMYNNAKTQMHALYAFNDPVEIVKGDSIQLGFSLHNSYDKSTGVGGGFFTFRHACKNMFMMGLNGQGMGFDTRKTLAYFSVAHTAERKKEDITKLMQGLTEHGMRIVNALRALRNVKLEEVQAVKLLDLLPKKVIETHPTIKTWATVDDDGEVKVTRKVNGYDAWNDLTDYLSHSKMGLETMTWKQSVVSKVLVAPLLTA